MDFKDKGSSSAIDGIVKKTISSIAYDNKLDKELTKYVNDLTVKLEKKFLTDKDLRQTLSDYVIKTEFDGKFNLISGLSQKH